MAFISGNEEQIQFTMSELQVYGSLNEQCLMVEQKFDDATMILNQPTLTALDPVAVSDHFDLMQENVDVQVLDLNDDIYASIMNEDVLFDSTDCYGKLSSNNCNLENPAKRSKLNEDGFVFVPNCVTSYTGDRNGNICETLLPSTSECSQPVTSTADDSLEIKATCSTSVPATKNRRRRRCGRLKEKLYMKTEPFSDEEMEKKRLNALKAFRNRIKQKDLFIAMEAENAELRNELQLSKSKIQELESVVRTLQEGHDQKIQSLHRLKDQLSTIIDL